MHCGRNGITREEGILALVGYIALENLDLQIDPKKQALIPNPEHGGKMVMDLFNNSQIANRQ